MTAPARDRPRRLWPLQATVPVLSALLLAAPASAAPDATPRPLSVLLLTVDSLRPDHLSCFGYPRPTSPRLDAFAREATLFRNALGSSAWTAPGVASLLLGLRPAVHGLDGRWKWPDPYLETPLDALARRGYRVEGYLGTGEIFGEMGFEPHDLSGEPLTRVLRELDRDRLFFLWYHLKTTHLPYASTPEDREAFARPGSPPLDERTLWWLTHSPGIPAGTVDWRPSQRPAVVDLYDAAVHRQDAQIGKVLDRLRTLGRWEDTVVVVTADHGEELLEHGEVGHASTTRAGTLYEEILRVPLLIRVPGLGEGRQVGDVVESVDVMPTLLGLLGIDGAPPMQGRSLVAALQGGSPPRHHRTFAETTLCGWQCQGDRERTTRLAAVRGERWKLIVSVDELGRRTPALYDLRRDPGELRDGAASHPRRVRRLSRVLEGQEEANLRLASRLATGAVAARERNLAAASAAERRTRAPTTCDDLRRLLDLYRNQVPSFLDRPGLARPLSGRMGDVLRLLGEDAGKYWVCAEVKEWADRIGTAR